MIGIFFMARNKFLNLLHEIRRGDGNRARSMRSAIFVILGFGGQNLIRLGGNLILTRLLFPEAFGLMALIQVFLIGLQMFSDIGIDTSIIRDPRAEERDFLNTAWTMQIIRGGILWGFSCVIAWPAATIYGEPRLMQLIPVAGLAALIHGFKPTKVALASRNLKIGAQVASELTGQTLGLLLMIALTFIWRDVWALVVGGLLGNILTILLQRGIVPGQNDKIHWDSDAFSSIFHLGKFIFFGSIAGFLSNQGDRVILGGYVTLEQLGIYTVGYTMGSMPFMLVYAASGKIGLPLYRKFPDLSISESRKKIITYRRLVVFGGFSLSSLLSLAGVPFMDILYDSRYEMSGPILILVCASMVLKIGTSNYEGAYMAHGDGRSHLYLTSVEAGLQVIILLLGVSYFGMLGAALAPGITMLLIYPIRSWVVRQYHAWDPMFDTFIMFAGIFVFFTSVLLWWENMQIFLKWSL